MELDEFQKQALKSVAVPGKGTDALAHRTLGLSGESGEVANRVKKIIRDSSGKYTEADVEFLRKKLGDSLYYVAVLAEFFGLTLDEIAEFNVEQSKKFIASKKEEREKSR